LIGHALATAPRAVAGRVVWDRWIAIGFAAGSACFIVGPFPGFVQLVGAGADGVVFFAGSVLFTAAAALELRESTIRLGRWAAGSSWWSAAVQFAGTLLFNISTFAAMQDVLSNQQENRLVWAPDVFGSACFLVSGALAYRVASGYRLRPQRRDDSWTTAAINLAGCALFGVAAIASYVVPSTGSILALAASNWCTALGALCFFVGALRIFPHAIRAATRAPSSRRPRAPGRRRARR
jgi:hypothetical protein